MRVISFDPRAMSRGPSVIRSRVAGYEVRDGMSPLQLAAIAFVVSAAMLAGWMI